MNYKVLLIGALGCFTALSSFADDIEVGGLFYSTNSDGTATVRKPSSADGETAPTGDIAIPASIGYNGTTYNVVAIDNSAFAYNTGITSLSIEIGRAHV